MPSRFNIALLGKQAWRLVSCREKLVSCVFKARYCPHGIFLTAKTGSSLSYIWRGVMEAQYLIKSGISCRVGSGLEVDILNTPWLPSHADPYVHSNNNALINQKVSSLMLPGEKTWDADLINDLFETTDADIILSIPLDSEHTNTWY